MKAFLAGPSEQKPIHRKWGPRPFSIVFTTGYEKILFVDIDGRFTYLTVDPVIWATGYMTDENGDLVDDSQNPGCPGYWYPYYPGMYQIDKSPKGAADPIEIVTHDKSAIRVHMGHHSEGCVVLGPKNNPIGQGINDTLELYVTMGQIAWADLRVVDKRIQADKTARPLPY